MIKKIILEKIMIIIILIIVINNDHQIPYVKIVKCLNSNYFKSKSWPINYNLLNLNLQLF